MLASRASEVMTEYMQGGPASCSVAAGVVAAAAGGACLVCQGDTRKATWVGRLWSLILGILGLGLRRNVIWINFQKRASAGSNVIHKEPFTMITVFCQQFGMSCSLLPPIQTM